MDTIKPVAKALACGGDVRLSQRSTISSVMSLSTLSLVSLLLLCTGVPRDNTTPAGLGLGPEAGRWCIFGSAMIRSSNPISNAGTLPVTSCTRIARSLVRLTRSECGICSSRGVALPRIKSDQAWPSMTSSGSDLVSTPLSVHSPTNCSSTS